MGEQELGGWNNSQDLEGIQEKGAFKQKKLMNGSEWKP